MIKKIHVLTYFVVVFSLFSIGYTGSYFSDIETSIDCSFTAADDWQSTIPCTRTLGYWKNHNESWTVNEITIGEITYAKQETIDIMWTPGAGDKTYDMFKQLVTAKLNILIGCNSSCIEQTIIDADAWMYDHPVGSGFPANSQAWQEGKPLKNTLNDYNKGELCAPHCNSLPYEPTNPTPYDDAIGVGINPTLSVYVSDPDNGTMDACFYNASDNSLIGNVVNAENNTTVSVVWLNLNYEVTYEWYVVVEDYDGSIQSDTWCFTTMDSPPRGGGGSEGGNSGGGSPPSNNPPMANAGGPYSGYVNETITFNGSGSTDDGTITSYLWDFGDGTNTTEINATTTHKYTNIGIYNVTLTVVDNNGETNTNTTKVTITSFLEINNVSATPNIQNISGHVNITCILINTSEVIDVILDTIYPDNTTSNISMIHSNETDCYFYNSTYPNCGEYTFFIFANDTSNNTVESNVSHFSMVDLHPPEIFDNTPETAYKNETFTFNATVTDNTVVADVYVEYWYETGNHTNISMNTTIDDYWRKNITVPSNYDLLQYCLHAKDASDNWSHTEIKSITLLERRG